MFLWGTVSLRQRNGANKTLLKKVSTSKFKKNYKGEIFYFLNRKKSSFLQAKGLYAHKAHSAAKLLKLGLEL